MSAVTADVAGVLLAAGNGSRLGRPKALVVVGGQSLVARGVGLLSGGGAAPVVVVTGAARPAGPQPDGTLTVHNPDWATGMGSSVVTGLAAVGERTTAGAAVLALADQPLVGEQSVRRLIAAWRDGAGVAVACYDGKPRNPVLIAARYWPEVAALAVGDVGARPFLRKHPELVTAVECGDTGSSDDIDSPEDLDRIERLLAGWPAGARRGQPGRHGAADDAATTGSGSDRVSGPGPAGPS